MAKLFVVGFGPGDYRYMTHQAAQVMREADVITGYTTYVELMKKIFPEKKYISTPMRQEIDRCRLAIDEALKGQTVAMISSGDSGIYGMAGIVLQMAEDLGADLEVEIVPGMTAASAAAAVLGAPLMHDFAVISLSDLMTPLEQIMKRVECAAAGDFVICLYNPKSKKRYAYVDMAAEIIMKHQPAHTPVGIVRNAGRDGEQHQITTLGALKDACIDMFCVVIIGNSHTYVADGRMITPRGYECKDYFRG